MSRKSEAAPDEEIVVNTTDMMRFLDRIEQVENEIDALRGDITDIWAEAKAAGYQTKMLKKAHSLRKLKREDREVLGVYANALSLFE